MATKDQLKELELEFAKITTEWITRHGLVVDRELLEQISDYMICDDFERNYPLNLRRLSF